MTKLLSLKEWVTLEEAARHLTNIFDEEVSVADIYRFALTGHLTLSAHFVNGTKAKVGLKTRIRDAGFKIIPSIVKDDSDEQMVQLNITGAALPEFDAWLEANAPMRQALESAEPKKKLVLLNGEQVSETECVQFGEDIESIDGLWDLVMLGGARLDIEHALQGVFNGPSVERIAFGGTLVSEKSGVFAWLQEPFNDGSKSFFPSPGLPSGTPIVVRPEAIFKFVSNVTGGEDKKLDTRERTTLLTIIGALADAARLDLNQHNKAGDAVAAMLRSKEVTLSGRTIGEHLKAVREAMDSRKMK